MMAIFVQRGGAVDFTPSRNVDAGEVLCFGSLLGIVKTPVKAGENGALHLSGVYDVAKLPEAIPAGSRVFWNVMGQVATVQSSGNAFLGVAAAHAPATASRARVILNFGHHDAAGSPSPEGIQWQTID